MDLASSRVFTKPTTMLDVPNLKLSSVSEKLLSAMKQSVSQEREHFAVVNSKLVSLNPMAVLSRGYGAVFDKDERVVNSIQNINIDDEISIKLSDGSINATVTSKEGRKTDAGKRG